jgi:hypothetical protein
VAVETGNESWCGADFITFENDRGEKFFFRKSVLMRGVPIGPFKNLEDSRRPAHLLTLRNCTNLVGISERTLRYHVKQGNLRAVKRVGKYGTRRWHGWLVNLEDLKEFVARQTFEKYRGKTIEWDVDAIGLVK